MSSQLVASPLQQKIFLVKETARQGEKNRLGTRFVIDKFSINVFATSEITWNFCWVGGWGGGGGGGAPGKISDRAH